MNTVRSGRGVEPFSRLAPNPDHRQTGPRLCDQRAQSRARIGHGRTHQHRHAGLLFLGVGRAAVRSGHCRRQEFHAKTYAKKGPEDRGDELESRGQCFGSASRSQSARKRQETARDSRRRRRARTPALDKAPGSFGMSWAKSSPDAGMKLPVSAFPCDGTFPTGTARFKTQPRLGNTRVGRECLHPMRQMRLRLIRTR